MKKYYSTKYKYLHHYSSLSLPPIDDCIRQKEIPEHTINEFMVVNKKIAMFYRIEELFEITLNLLLDFNTYSYSLADNDRYVTHPHGASFEWSIKGGMKIVNYLSAFQMYFAYICRILSQNKDKADKDAFLLPFYNNLAYRQCKYLRNFSQHVGLFDLYCTFHANDLFSSRFYKMQFLISKDDLLSRDKNGQKSETKAREDFSEVFGDIETIDFYRVLAESFDVLQDCHRELRVYFMKEYEETCMWITDFINEYNNADLVEECSLGEGEKEVRKLLYLFVDAYTKEMIEKLRSKNTCKKHQSNNFVAAIPQELESVYKASFLKSTFSLESKPVDDLAQLKKNTLG